MTLLRTGLLSAIAVVVKMVALLAINKVLAIYVGPSGYAALGQFQNIVQIGIAVPGSMVNAGVVKHTAQYASDQSRQHGVWSTAFVAAVTSSGFIGVGALIFGDYLARAFLGGVEFRSVFYWFAAAIVFLALNVLFLAIMNGKKDIGRYVLANVAGSLAALVVTYLLVVRLGLYGALIAVVVYQAVSFIFTLFLMWTAPWFSFRSLFLKPTAAAAKSLLGFAVLALSSAAFLAITQLIIRTFLVNLFGGEVAGYWDAITRLSGAYLMIVTTTLSVYYLPRLAELSDRRSLKREIYCGWLVIVPFSVAMSVLVYILRDFVIVSLFSAEFLPMRALFAWQLVGDVVKVCSWLITYLLMGKDVIRPLIIAEFFYGVFLVFLTMAVAFFFGWQKVAHAYAVSYFFYFICLYWIMNRRVFGSVEVMHSEVGISHGAA